MRKCPDKLDNFEISRATYLVLLKTPKILFSKSYLSFDGYAEKKKSASVMQSLIVNSLVCGELMASKFGRVPTVIHRKVDNLKTSFSGSRDFQLIHKNIFTSNASVFV
ncbi:pantoate ligase/cytidylate kinase [Trichinella spiralis]|uniref:pantoate ligase/cytidylate kinase n=1 Tax=Trichinella spiralis TaxID=6334 RepID=UPI0001EFC2D5|nr:pantoate ligase/cytidylate kinase [Trichinella spiralis]